MSQINNSEIHPIIISDHGPLSFDIVQEATQIPSSRWRFNTSLLADTDFNNLLTREWTSFIKLNDSSEISPCVLWETAKAVNRGCIISYSAHKKKKEQEKQQELQHKLKHLHSQHSRTPTEQTQNEIQKVKTQLDNMIHQQTQFLMQRTRLNYFEHNEKTGKFLANQLKRNKEKSLITAIQDTQGNLWKRNKHNFL